VFLGSHEEKLVLALLLSFAALATAHLALVWGLAWRAPRWRALVALPVAPLAPFWGFRDGMHVRAAVWVVSAIAYIVARVMARG
jgi:hypothetical protein